MSHLPEPYPPDYESPAWGPKKDPREDPNPDEVGSPRKDAPGSPNVPKSPRRRPSYHPVGPTAERSDEDCMAPIPRFTFR